MKNKYQVIADNVTGLMWLVFLKDHVTKVSWFDAFQFNDQVFDGLSNWRIPTIQEYLNLTTSLISQDVFSEGKKFWSCLPLDVYFTGKDGSTGVYYCAQYFDFEKREAGYDFRQSLYPILLVRGGDSTIYQEMKRKRFD